MKKRLRLISGLLGVYTPSHVICPMPSARNRIIFTDLFAYGIFIILCAGSIFVHSQLFTDSYIVPKWLFAILALLGLGLYGSAGLLLNKPVKIDIALAGMSIAVVCLALAIYGILQYFGLFSSHSEYKITGSYDNPAGFAASLCGGLPFAGFLLTKGNKKYIQYAGWAVAVIIIIAVVLSYSRAGIVSLAAICTILLFQKLKQKWVWKCLLSVVIALLLLSCYWMKKDSADGRLLIWQCGIDMAKDAPWTGYGTGSFEAHYMDYQASYFRQHEHDRFSMLADNVKQPFNEYLAVLLDFGIIGLLVLLTLIGTLFHCYKKKPDAEKRIALYVLISIGTFSLFSYPFTYPFVWIVSFFCIFIITQEYIRRYLLAIPSIKNILCISVIVCSLAGIYKLVERVQAEMTWNAVATCDLFQVCEATLHTYAMLESKLGDNPYFLYNYAVVLLEKKQYEKSLRVALKCRRYWADYDLELILGENYQRLRQPARAVGYYQSASMMCPSRFLPLYKQFYLYKENREDKQALAVAEAIINKPIKIVTPAIRMIKREMNREILR